MINIDDQAKKDTDTFAQLMRDVYSDIKSVLVECAERESRLREEACRYCINVDDDYWYV